MIIERERIGRTRALPFYLLAGLMTSRRFPNGRFRGEAHRDRAQLRTPGGRGVACGRWLRPQAGSIIPDFSAISPMSLDYRDMDIYGLYNME